MFQESSRPEGSTDFETCQVAHDRRPADDSLPLPGHSLLRSSHVNQIELRIAALPSLRSLSQLRALLPYAAKLLPVLTGVAVGETALQRTDLSSFNRHFGEIQSESRGLRSQVEGQGEQLERLHTQLDRIASSIESGRKEQQELAGAFRSLAGLLKGLFFAILFLLVAVTAMCVLMLLRMPRV
jgi:hypothetical protein